MYSNITSIYFDILKKDKSYLVIVAKYFKFHLLSLLFFLIFLHQAYESVSSFLFIYSPCPGGGALGPVRAMGEKGLF